MARDVGPGTNRRVALALAAALAVLSVSALSAGATTRSTGLTLKPGIGPPTTRVVVTGSGFGSSEVVVTNFGAATVTSVTTSSTGSFSTSFKVPKSAAPGSHLVTSTGQTTGRSASNTFVVQTDWAKFHFDGANTGQNPYENVIGSHNVAGLTEAWTGMTSGPVISSPAVANGVVYVGAFDGNLYAFGAAGTTGCSGTPETCNPLWTGVTGGAVTSSPAVANGMVYVGSSDGKLDAFSATGTTGCSGTPKNCSPLWTATTGGDLGNSSPAVAGGAVFVGSGDDKLYAFSATGSTDCSGTPKICSPIWTGLTGGPAETTSLSSPAVASGIVYMGSYDGNLYAFSAKATSNCAGLPTICSPLWTAATGGQIQSSPAVASGIVYVGSNDGKLYAFSAAGMSGCSGAPRTCSPLWTATPAVGQPVASSPAVADGVVYVGSSDSLYAFSAAGITGCSGAPKTCAPLWVGGTTTGVASSPAIANGFVYVGSIGSRLWAFHL